MTKLPACFIQLAEDPFNKEQVQEFWGFEKDVSHFLPRDIKGVSDSVKSQCYPIYIAKTQILHAGGIWEMCEYFNVPYPKAEIETWKREEEIRMYNSGKEQAEMLWKNAQTKFPKDKAAATKQYFELVDTTLKKWKEWISQLQQAVEDCGIQAMRADHTDRLAQLRIRALWGVLILQLEMFEIEIEGVEKAFAPAQ